MLNFYVTIKTAYSGIVKKKWNRTSKIKRAVFKAVYVAFLPFDFNMHHHWL